MWQSEGMEKSEFCVDVAGCSEMHGVQCERESGMMGVLKEPVDERLGGGGMS